MGFFSRQPPEQGLIDSYGVVYQGGLPEYAKEKAGKIDFKVFSDRFEFLPTLSTKTWFSGLTIPYSSVTDLQVVQRTVGTLEAILGGLDSKQLNQANNIHITFRSIRGDDLVLRLEMLSGITVMGQAKKCLELMDRLKIHRVTEQFQAAQAKQTQHEQSMDIPEQIGKLASLRDKGVLSEDEFIAKKAELLSRL
jgi:hypothetical protein